MRVFRVQNENGVGPYRGPGRPDRILQIVDDHQYGDKWPLPREDHLGELFFGCDVYLCGFCSFRQLLDWFEIETLSELAALGWMVYEYDVEKVHEGFRQAAFLAPSRDDLVAIHEFRHGFAGEEEVSM